MSNWLIFLILVIILFPGMSPRDYLIRKREWPWWIIVLAGFSVSLLGLLKFNDDRIVLGGCAILALAKLYSRYDEPNWAPEVHEEKAAGGNR